MPQIHLGVYLTSGNETFNAVKWALEVGIKLILLLQDEDSADDALRPVIERKGGKNCTQRMPYDLHFLASIRPKCIIMNAKLDHLF